MRTKNISSNLMSSEFETFKIISKVERGVRGKTVDVVIAQFQAHLQDIMAGGRSLEDAYRCMMVSWFPKIMYGFTYRKNETPRIIMNE